jgi:hydrogenase expression/formation protein HypC
VSRGGIDLCLGIPARVISIDGNSGMIEVGRVKREAFMHLVPEVQIGDYVLVHAGCAIQILDQVEASRAIEFLKELMGNEIY